MSVDYDIIAFDNQTTFREWLETHSTNTPGLWMRIYKKASGKTSITYAEALDEALCYGWIDGQRKSYDEVSYLQKFTPRRQRSIWSKRNTEHIARLTEAGLMTDRGMQEVERAKADGRWEAAYDGPSEMNVPEEFMRELGENPQAKRFFDTLGKTSKYSIAWRLQTAKTEATFKRRLDKIIAMLEAGDKP